MTRTCEWCGEPFEAKRSTAKFCTSGCRAKSSNASKRAPKPAPASVTPLPERSALVAAVERELTAAKRLDTALGAQAVALATRIDSGADTGSAVAALSKELRAVMDAALADAETAADPLDELRARRERKFAGG